MQLTTGPWTGDEYRILHEGRDVETTARLLNRSPDEVRRKVDLDFDDWYRRRRCPGAPRTYRSIWDVAWTIYRKDGYDTFFTEGEMTQIILTQAESCFRYFDAEKYPKAIPVKLKFMGYFTHCLRRRMKQRRLREATKRRGLVALSFGPVLSDWAIREPWATTLLRAALPRLKERSRRFVELRYLNEMPMKEVAQRIGVAEQTLYNTLSKKQLASEFRAAIRSHLLSLPPARVAAAVRYLDDDGFNERAIASLMCLPEEDVRRLLEFPVPADLVCRTREEAMTLLGADDVVGVPRKAMAA